MSRHSHAAHVEIRKVREYTDSLPAIDGLMIAVDPQHPDADLITICSEALRYATAANGACADGPIPHWRSPERSDWGVRHAERVAQFARNRMEVVWRLRRAKWIDPKTPVGTLAKAALARCALQVGAADYAVDIAADLIEAPSLRQMATGVPL